MIRKVLLVASSVAVSSCSAVPKTACDIAVNPAAFGSRIETLQETIVADPGLDPILVPDASCPRFAYFEVDFATLDEPSKSRFRSLLFALNESKSTRMGIAGKFRLKVERQIAPDVWSVSLLKADGMKRVPANSKDEAIRKQVPQI